MTDKSKRRKESVLKRIKEKDRRERIKGRMERNRMRKESDGQGQEKKGQRSRRIKEKDRRTGKGTRLSLRLLVRSDLLPTRIKGMFESCFTRRICSRNS
jgi:hypothetical protein